MKVGDRIIERVHTLGQKKRTVLLGVGTFVLLSGISVFTVTTVSNLVSKSDDNIDIIESNVGKDSESTVGDLEGLIDKSELGFDGKLALVNRGNKLSKDFVPKDLVVPNIRFNGDVANKSVRVDVATALEDMFSDAKKSNITLLGVSGYRSYDYQDGLYKRRVATSGKSYADKYVAVAGASEHQLGLAMDLVSTEYTNLDAGFANTKSYKWLEDNMQDYGFILRYPKGKEDITGYNYEPWHLRYVGVEVAKDIKEKDVTLEEYLGSENNN